jgi:hypothetical protein
MEQMIHCSLRIRGVQAFWSFELPRDEDETPYAETGTDKDRKAITYYFDPAHIIPDRAGRAEHFEYRQEIVVT